MTRRAVLVADLGFGDAGKGTVVDYLTHAHAADLIVRYNGGPQAAHNVVTPDGRHHTFAQFGSGLFHASARTLLAEHVLIEPYAMLNEADHLRAVGVPDALARTTIDARCRVIAPPQQIANRLRERARGAAAHGTCGMGIGETVADALADPDDALRAGDLANEAAIRRKLAGLTVAKRRALGSLLDVAKPDERRVFEDLSWIDTAAFIYRDVARQVRIASADGVHATVREARCAIFEGAQGVLLDEHFGFDPHTTWSDTTFRHADALLTAAGFDGDVRRVGVLRTYATRHGPGPFVSESADLAKELPEPHNSHAGWQGRFRCGPIDLVGLRYALAALGGEVSLAVTHLDRLTRLPAVACVAYERDGVPVPPLVATVSAAALAGVTPVLVPWPVESADAFVAALETALGRRVVIRSFGSTWADKTTHDE